MRPASVLSRGGQQGQRKRASPHRRPPGNRGPGGRLAVAAAGQPRPATTRPAARYPGPRTTRGRRAQPAGLSPSEQDRRDARTDARLRKHREEHTGNFNGNGARPLERQDEPGRLLAPLKVRSDRHLSPGLPACSRRHPRRSRMEDGDAPIRQCRYPSGAYCCLTNHALAAIVRYEHPVRWLVPLVVPRHADEQPTPARWRMISSTVCSTLDSTCTVPRGSAVSLIPASTSQATTGQKLAKSKAPRLRGGLHVSLARAMVSRECRPWKRVQAPPGTHSMSGYHPRAG